MSKCQWENCDKEATTKMNRFPTDEERAATFKQNSLGAVFAGIIEKNVCDDHIEPAKQYGYSK